MKRFFTLLVCLSLVLGLFSGTAYAAPTWPDSIAISAEGGIVIDADSGAVIYGKNIHQQYFPASITKVLTALLIIENCNMDDVVTFSHNAVYNVEAGSSNAGLDEGDQLTVRDCLYALLIRSANESANALAEHTAGSVEAFAAMMNARASSLGCENTHFTNPSGLNDPEHYTTAYDMALIAKEAFQNETFVQIASTLYYDLPVTKRNPEGLRIYPGHRMLKKNMSQYYPGIIGGKTGYTSLAGNTLVTAAERNGMRLIAVVLNGHQTHYTDTKALLDFGFTNFKSVDISRYGTAYTSLENDMTIAGLPTTDLSVLKIQNGRTITLPNSAEITDATSEITYDLPASAPTDAIAQISYRYNDRLIGSSYLLLNEAGAAATSPVVDITTAAPEESSNPESTGDASETTNAPQDKKEKPAFQIPSVVWIVLSVIAGLAVIVGGLIGLKIYIEKREEAERLTRYNRRQRRLQDIGMSTAEFDLLMQQKRTQPLIKPDKSPRRGRRKHKSFLDPK